jgi:hypothetical protein
MNIPNFDWGVNLTDPGIVYKEIFEDRIYEKFRDVREGDVVVDIGANIGAFTHSILDKNPEHVYCVEPSNACFDVLFKNTKHNSDVITYINKGFDNVESDNFKIIKDINYIYGHTKDTYKTTTFKNFIAKHKIDKIDFMKIDCEGGEYSVFNKENRNYIQNNVKYIAGEWHLSDIPEFIKGFMEFRDLYLKGHKSHFVYTRDGLDVTTWIYDDNYIKYYSDTLKGGAQFIIYILNV